MSISAIHFGEFGLSPFKDEVGQDLRFDRLSWLVGNLKRQELDGPFGNSSGGILIVNDLTQWYF